MRQLTEETFRVLSYAITEDVPDKLKLALEQDTFIFSGFKTYHQLREVSALLQDENGGYKSFEKFYQDVLRIHQTYNKNYLQAEYNFAVQSTQMAVKWQDFERDGDRYLIQYRTAGDDKVRAEHAPLHNTTLPVNDPFWENYLPPLGWNCRCTAVQVLRDKYESAMRRGVIHREEYAVQNFLVRVQGFLISCATYGFLSNYDAIMEGSYCRDLFAFTYGKGLLHLLGDMACRYVFVSKPIFKLEIAAETVLNSHLDRFVRAALHYDTDVPQRDVDQKLMALVSENYKQTYHTYAQGKKEEERLYLRLLLVTDYICGMTDGFAKSLYQELGGIW